MLLQVDKYAMQRGHAVLVNLQFEVRRWML